MGTTISLLRAIVIFLSSLLPVDARALRRHFPAKVALGS
jgi:hypothetical protein